MTGSPFTLMEWIQGTGPTPEVWDELRRELEHERRELEHMWLKRMERQLADMYVPYWPFRHQD